MKKSILLWILAFIFTSLVAYYQRTTGPTYPITGKVSFAGEVIKYKLLTTHDTGSDYILAIPLKNENVKGILKWKRYNTADEWRHVKMVYNEGFLEARLPNQPPAGKLEYTVEFSFDGDIAVLPAGRNVIIRFKGKVPLSILIPHIIAMFGAMFLSTRTGLEFFSSDPKFNKLTYWTISFLFIGGFILGPIIQYYAFGAFWTGFPYGYDLTDNKTLIAMIGWIIAWMMYKRSKEPKNWALGAAILLILIYLIPHSVLGSELDYEKLDKEQKIQTIK